MTQLKEWKTISIDISSKKKYKWPTSMSKDAQYYQAPRKYKLKPQRTYKALISCMPSAGESGGQQTHSQVDNSVSTSRQSLALISTLTQNNE